jgi:hypothetical protein
MNKRVKDVAAFISRFADRFGNAKQVDAERQARLAAEAILLADDIEIAETVRGLLVRRWMAHVLLPVAGGTPNGGSDYDVPDGGKSYADAATEVVKQLQERGTTYGYQLDGSGQREQDFLTDDSKCDCAKFVLIALLDADNVNYNTGTYEGIQVPAFGGAEVKDLTAVDGMRTVINNLVAANRAAAIRPDDPKIGDIMFWTGHVAMTTGVRKSNGDVLVSFAMMGSTPASDDDIPLTKISANQKPYHFGAGSWLGFWTPLQ